MPPKSPAVKTSAVKSPAVKSPAVKTPKDALAIYNAMRDFKQTAEPQGAAASRKGKALKATGTQSKGIQPIYVVQKHAATRLHWDFRLELDGILKSWAVTNEPVADPEIKRLAVRTEDHPLDYATFAGDIPKGQYGGGHVDIWDNGTWQPHEDANAALARGKLGFTLYGGRMEGDWALVKLKHDRSGSKRENWLLIKEKEDYKAGKLAAADGKPASATPKPRNATAKRPAWVKAVTAAGKKKLATIAYQPELATRVELAPGGDDWLHELKFDGYRALLHVKASAKGKSVQIVTRNGLDWTHRFPLLAKALEKLKVEQAALDGEIVVLDAEGHTDFSGLQETLGGESELPFTFMAFDLLSLDGKDLRRKPLLERKAQLQKILRSAGTNSPLRYSEHVIGNGQRFFDEAKKLKAEGIISKRVDSLYTGKRGGDWLKIKAGQRQEFVVGGITRRSDNKKNVGAILIGTFEGTDFVYRGRVGTGFAGPVSDTIMAAAAKLFIAQSPFTSGAKPETRGVEWLKPQLVGEVEFAEFTREGVVRHGAFKGLRADKAARAVNLERVQTIKTDKPRAKATQTPARSAPSKSTAVKFYGIEITHPERVVYPEDNFTKLDVARYYADHAELILKYLADRPLTLLRCPAGLANGGKSCFYQRHIDAKMSGSAATKVKQLGITDSESGDPYFSIATPEQLLALVQLNAIEFHTWNTARAPFRKPDQLIFDLDPDPRIDWPSVKAAARTVRDELKALKLECLLKTTGGKGLHVVVPLDAAPDWQQTKAFCRAFADYMERVYPQAFTSNPMKVKRRDKIYLDYLRNDDTATAVAPYTLRSRAGAPVSVPITWEELPKLMKPDLYTIGTLDKRLSSKTFKDPWVRRDQIKQSLTVAMVKQMQKAAKG